MSTRRESSNSALDSHLPQQLDLPLVSPAPTRPGEWIIRAVRLNGRVMSYRLRRSRRKTIALYVDPNGLYVAAPRWVAIAEIERFMLEKERWIVAKMVEVANRAPGFQWTEGAELVVFDRSHRIVISASAQTVIHHDGQILVPQAWLGTERLRRTIVDWIRTCALPHFEALVHLHAPALGVAIPQVRLSNARTRWGSCSIARGGKAQIRLNWRLALLPPRLSDYVVVHELAHLREMNHSPRFWAWVARAYPGYREAERELRQRGRLIPAL